MAVLAGTAGAAAQEYTLSARLVLKEQLPSKFSEKTRTYTDTIRTTRLSNNYLLGLLQPFYTGTVPNGFPLGSRLVLVNYQYFQVKSPSGIVLVENTSPYLTYTDTYSQTNFLFQGREHIDNESLNLTYFYQSTIQFNDPSPEGTSFTFTANTMERYIRGRENSQGLNPSTGSLSMTGIGSGFIGGKYILISGTFKSPLTGWWE